MVPLHYNVCKQLEMETELATISDRILNSKNTKLAPVWDTQENARTKLACAMTCHQSAHIGIVRLAARAGHFLLRATDQGTAFHRVMHRQANRESEGETAP